MRVVVEHCRPHLVIARNASVYIVPALLVYQRGQGARNRTAGNSKSTGAAREVEDSMRPAINIPAGFRQVTSGKVAVGDRIWGRNQGWKPVFRGDLYAGQTILPQSIVARPASAAARALFE